MIGIATDGFWCPGTITKVSSGGALGGVPDMDADAMEPTTVAEVIRPTSMDAAAAEVQAPDLRSESSKPGMTSKDIKPTMIIDGEDC
jgi:hypothetical protein